MSVPAGVRAYFKEADEYVADYIRQKCFTFDTEVDHATADEILVELLEELGFHETITVYKSVDKWYA